MFQIDGFSDDLLERIQLVGNEDGRHVHAVLPQVLNYYLLALTVNS